MWEEMWENTSENPLFIYKIQYLMRWFGTSPATNPLSSGIPQDPWKSLVFCGILPLAIHANPSRSMLIRRPVWG